MQRVYGKCNITFVFSLTKDLQKMPLRKFFCIRYFSKTNNYRSMFLMSKQVSLPKISSILQKMKINPKGKMRQESFNYNIIIVQIFLDTLSSVRYGQRATVISCHLSSTIRIFCFDHNKENFNEEDQTFKFEKHVSATPVPSSVYGWNYNDEQYSNILSLVLFIKILTKLLLLRPIRKM